MPLFTVTMKSNRSVNEKDRLSRAIHAASVVAGYPEDDLFQRFLSLDPSDLRVDPYYPAPPKPRTDQMLMIEVLVDQLPPGTAMRIPTLFGVIKRRFLINYRARPEVIKGILPTQANAECGSSNI